MVESLHYGAQYYTWGIGVSIGNQERFIAQPNDFDNYWTRAYANVLTDLDFLIKSEQPSYRGAARILKVYTYQGLVDHFGDVPYAEAIKGAPEDGSVLTPTFGDDAAIYPQLVAEIDEALKDLDSPVASTMGSDDLIYGGDLAKWKKFGNSLKLRLLLRMSTVSDQGDAVRALISSGDFIQSADDIAKINFLGTSGDENPMYARFTFGVGDFYFASLTTLDVLDELGDPRGTYFYSVAEAGPQANNLRGIPQGDVDDFVPFTDPANHYSGSNPLIYGADQPVYFMTNWEVDFLRAEAAVRYNTADDAGAMLMAGVQANFDFLGAGDATTYVNDLDFAGAGSMDDQLNIIGVQKWISMNGTQEDEGWIEARRFDREGNRIFTGTDGIWAEPTLSVLGDRVFPSIWLYPADELSFNPSAPAQRDLTEKVFWDN